MVRVRPLAESINILAGTKGLPLDAAYSAWADQVEADRKAAAKAAKQKAADDKAKASVKTNTDSDKAKAKAAAKVDTVKVDAESTSPSTKEGATDKAPESNDEATK